MAEQMQAPARLVELSEMQAAAVAAGAVCTTACARSMRPWAAASNRA